VDKKNEKKNSILLFAPIWTFPLNSRAPTLDIFDSFNFPHLKKRYRNPPCCAQFRSPPRLGACFCVSVHLGHCERLLGLRARCVWASAAGGRISRGVSPRRARETKKAFSSRALLVCWRAAVDRQAYERKRNIGVLENASAGALVYGGERRCEASR
jgi:hypothetical protein